MDWLAEARRLDTGAAIELLEQAVAQGHENAAICKEIARLNLSINEIRAFNNWCHEAMRIDPSDSEPALMMARVLMASGRVAEAVETLEAAMARTSLSEPQRAEAESLLAQAKFPSART